MPEQNLFRPPDHDHPHPAASARIQAVRRKKGRKRKIAGIWAVAVSLALIAGIYLAYGQDSHLQSSDMQSIPAAIVSTVSLAPQPVSPPPAVSVPQIAESVAEPEPARDAPVSNIPRNEWYLLLVNHANPLPEDFDVPVEPIDQDGRYFDARAIEPLLQMLDDCRAAGLQPKVVSGSRSREFQQGLFDARAAQLRADGLGDEEATQQTLAENMAPGENEHNLGLAVDIVAVDNQRMGEDFLTDPVYAWLLEHAPEYGFIQRYPPEKAGITGVAFEPWHFRYVGMEQARLIADSGLCLEEYLAE